MDTERGARTSGSRFVYLLGDIVHVQFALVRHALDILAAKGFLPVIPPVLVREEAMYGTGFLPTDQVNIYVTTEDELYLAGTSEVPLAAFRMGEIVEEAELPLRYAGYSTCFRREAGTYGKDMGGMFRVHQFDKVEMFSFCRPEESWDEHELMVGIEEEIVGNLGLPYRVVNIAAGDLGGQRCEEVRPRGLAARPRPVPRAHVLLELHRLPGSTAADPGPPRGRFGRGAPHAERHGDRHGAHAHRDPGEPPTRGRHGPASVRAASLPAGVAARAGTAALSRGRLSGPRRRASVVSDTTQGAIGT